MKTPPMYTCNRCGAKNHIVNQCRCDKNNLPTKVPVDDIIDHGDGAMSGELHFYSEDWAAPVRFTEKRGWEKYNITESKYEKIGPPTITWNHPAKAKAVNR